jgi:hypothetical protein
MGGRFVTYRYKLFEARADLPPTLSPFSPLPYILPLPLSLPHDPACPDLPVSSRPPLSRSSPQLLNPYSPPVHLQPPANTNMITPHFLLTPILPQCSTGPSPHFQRRTSSSLPLPFIPPSIPTPSMLPPRAVRLDAIIPLSTATKRNPSLRTSLHLSPTLLLTLGMATPARRLSLPNSPRRNRTAGSITSIRGLSLRHRSRQLCSTSRG